MRSPCRSFLFSQLNSPSAGTSSRPWLGKLQNASHTRFSAGTPDGLLSLPWAGAGPGVRGSRVPSPWTARPSCPPVSVRPSVPLSAPSGAAVTPRAPIGRFKSRGLLERRGRLQARPAPPLRPRRLLHRAPRSCCGHAGGAGKPGERATAGGRQSPGSAALRWHPRGAGTAAGSAAASRDPAAGEEGAAGCGGTGKGQRRFDAARAVRVRELTAALPTGSAGRLRGPWSGGGVAAAAASTSALLHPCG